MKLHKVLFAELPNVYDMNYLSNATYSYPVTESITAFVKTAVS
jgi:hypothetical protein